MPRVEYWFVAPWNTYMAADKDTGLPMLYEGTNKAREFVSEEALLKVWPDATYCKEMEDA